MLYRHISSKMLILIIVLFCLTDIPVTSHAKDDSKIIYLAWNQNETDIALTSNNGEVAIYNLDQRNVVNTISSSVQYTRAIWNFDGTKLAIGTANGHVEIRDSRTLALLHLVELSNSNPITLLDWNQDGTDLLIMQSDGSPNLFIWNFASGNLTLHENVSTPSDARWSTNGQWLAISYVIPHVSIRDTKQYSATSYIGLSLETIRDQIINHQSLTNILMRLDWSPDDLKIVTGATDGTVTLWEVNTNKLIYQEQANNLDILNNAGNQSLFTSDVWFSPDGSSFNSVTVGGTYRRWDTSSGDLLLDINLFLDAPIDFGQISPETSLFAYVDYENQLHIIEIASSPTIEDIRNKIRSCVENEGIETSLMVKLNPDELSAFINELEAQEGKQIPTDCANELLIMAAQVQE